MRRVYKKSQKHQINILGPLRAICQKLIYKEIPNAIGQEFTLNLLRNDIGDQLLEKFNHISGIRLDLLHTPLENINYTLEDSGFLDLEFSMKDDFIERCENPKEVLKSQFFIHRKEDLSEEDQEIEKEAFEIILDGALKSINEDKLYFKSYCSSLMGEKNWDEIKKRRDFKGRRKRIFLEEVYFKVDDTCITNMPSIWMWKYFYM